MCYKNTCLCKWGENYTSELEFYPSECASFHQSSSLCLVVSLPAPQTLSRSPGPTLYHDWWRAPSLLSLLIRSASQPVPSASGSALRNLLDLKPPNGAVPDSPSSFSCVILPWASLALLLEKEKKIKTTAALTTHVQGHLGVELLYCQSWCPCVLADRQ